MRIDSMKYRCEFVLRWHNRGSAKVERQTSRRLIYTLRNQENLAGSLLKKYFILLVETSQGVEEIIEFQKHTDRMEKRE